jgi:hypothetical protein
MNLSFRVSARMRLTVVLPQPLFPETAILTPERSLLFDIS